MGKVIISRDSKFNRLNVVKLFFTLILTNCYTELCVSVDICALFLFNAILSDNYLYFF